MLETLYQPTCTGCSHNVYYSDAIPKRTCGVMMHCGEHYCTGGKRARRFKRGDLKSRVPAWCPKRKTPCEFRVYALKSLDDWCLHDLLSEGLGEILSPTASRYALRLEGTIELTPQEFWTRCDQEPAAGLLSAAIQLYEVLEIDDGLEPVFFYKDKADLHLVRDFDTGRARENTMESYSGPSCE